MASFTARSTRAAPRLDLTEDLFGHRVADPYRWLEDADSPQTSQWLAAEEELWAAYRAACPTGDGFAGAGARAAAGRVRGPARLARHDAVLQPARPRPGARRALRRRLTRAERALIDPVAIDPSGRTTLDAWQPDKEGRLLAYQLSHGRRRGVAAAGHGRRDRASSWTGRSTGAGTRGWPGCPAARRSTTCGGCRPKRCPRARRSTTGGCTCTWWGRRRRRTRWCSAQGATRPPTTGPASAGTGAG